MRTMMQFFLVLFLLTTTTACHSTDNPRLISNFDDNWRFHLGDTAQAQAVYFNDHTWRKLDLPHDWSIEGAFDEKSPAGAGGG